MGRRPVEAPGAAAAGRWPILLVLVLAHTVMAFQFQSVAAVGPLLIETLGVERAGLGALVGAFMLPGVVVALPGGLLGQRFGDKPVVLAALLLMALGGLWVALAPGLAGALGGRVLGGTGAVLLNVLLAKMVADWFAGHEIVTAMAVLLSSWPIGIGAALVGLSALGELTSPAAALLTTPIASLLAFAAVALLYQAPAGTATPASLRPELSRRELALASLAGLVWTLYNVGFIVVLSFGPDFLVARGRSVAEAGALISIVTWAIIPALPLGGRLAEHLERPDLTMVACFLACALAIWVLPREVGTAAVLALIGLLYGPPAGLIMKLPTEALRAGSRAAGMGLYFTWYYAGMAALPPLAGLLRDLSGDPATPLLFAGAMMAAATLALAPFRLLQRRPPNPA